MAENKIIRIDEKEAEGIVGGYLLWSGWKKGCVHPAYGGPIYFYDDYSACIQWLDRNWVGERDEKCLEALAEIGLMHR